MLGFAIAFSLAILAHRRRWLQAPLGAATGVLYTIPSVAFFFLLLPLTGRGVDTAVIALTAFNLQIIYRNTTVGLSNVPSSVKDAARGIGQTDRQILWRVEIPLATPEIIAGLRIATVSTVAIATLAALAGGGGLGVPVFSEGISFKTNLIIAGGIVIAMALIFDAILFTIQRLATPWERVARAMRFLLPHLPLGSIQGAVEFIFSPQPSNVTGGKLVGGFEQTMELALTQLEVTVFALILSLVLALPFGLWLGHKGVGELVAIGVGNAGRAIPELVLIAFMAAAIGVGVLNLTIALAVLGIPPILTNSFIGVRQVDRAPVDAARGIGMSELEVLLKVELPLAIPTVMAGVRLATIAIVSTATIAPLAGVLTLGDYIINENVYGENGVVAGAIVVAVMALGLELLLALLQRRLTSPGLKPSLA